MYSSTTHPPKLPHGWWYVGLGIHTVSLISKEASLFSYFFFICWGSLLCSKHFKYISTWYSDYRFSMVRPTVEWQGTAHLSTVLLEYGRANLCLVWIILVLLPPIYLVKSICLGQLVSQVKKKSGNSICALLTHILKVFVVVRSFFIRPW